MTSFIREFLALFFTQQHDKLGETFFNNKNFAVPPRLFHFPQYGIILLYYRPGANLMNIQRLGLRLGLKKASSCMDRGLSLTVIF